MRKILTLVLLLTGFTAFAQQHACVLKRRCVDGREAVKGEYILKLSYKSSFGNLVTWKRIAETFENCRFNHKSVLFLLIVFLCCILDFLLIIFKPIFQGQNL